MFKKILVCLFFMSACTLCAGVQPDVPHQKRAVLSVTESTVKNYAAGERTGFKEINFRGDRIVTVAFDDGGTQWRFGSVRLFPDGTEWVRYISDRDGVEIHIAMDRLDRLEPVPAAESIIPLYGTRLMIETGVEDNRFFVVNIRLDGAPPVTMRFFRVNGHWFIHPSNTVFNFPMKGE